MNQHSIPAEICKEYAQELLPFGSVGINLSPSDPPCSWPSLADLEPDDPLPSQEDLERYLADIAASDEILIHANGPVLRNHTSVCIDLKIMLVFLKDTAINEPRNMFNLINRERNTERGIFQLAKWTWPSSFGRWEADWVSRGYYQPTYSMGDLPIRSVDQSESTVEYFCGRISNGAWRYWVNQWYPVHHRGVGNSFGTYFTVSKEFLEKFKKHADGNYYLIAEMTLVDGRDLVRRGKEVKTFAILPV